MAGDLFLGRFGRDQHPVATGRQRHHLLGAGALQEEHGVPGRRRGAAHRQRAVVAQQHDRLVAKVVDQALALIEVERDALIVVIGEPWQGDQGMLGERQEALGLGGDGDALVGVHVNHVLGVLARGVDGRVDGETRRIDEIGRVLEDVAVKVDLHQRRGGDLLEEIAVRIDQELVLRPWNPGGNVGVDQVVPAFARHKAIEGGEIDADLPFFLADLAF